MSKVNSSREVSRQDDNIALIVDEYAIRLFELLMPVVDLDISIL